MQGNARILGLEDVLKAMQAAFPNDVKTQNSIVRGAIGGSARKTLLQVAKQLAFRGDSSGALSESLGVRAKGKRAIKTTQHVGHMEIVPVRSNLKAMAMYIAHYYTRLGKVAPAFMIISGIRHGHLVEFGTVHSAAFPFLWPAISASEPYRLLVAKEMARRTEAAVRRAAKRRAANR